MATYGVSFVATFVAWDTVANAPKTGDAANIAASWTKDGTNSATTNSAVEVHATRARGLYSVVMTAGEAQAVSGTIGGTSSTPGVEIIPQQFVFGRLPNVAPGANGGLALVDAEGKVAAKIATGDIVDIPAPRAAKIDYLDVTVSSRGTSNYAGTDTAGTTSLLARIPAALTGDGLMKADTLRVGGALQTAGDLAAGVGSILSKLLRYFQLALRKDAAIATDNAAELAAINADGGSGGGAYYSTTDSQQAARDGILSLRATVQAVSPLVLRGEDVPDVDGDGVAIPIDFGSRSGLDIAVRSRVGFGNTALHADPAGYAAVNPTAFPDVIGVMYASHETSILEFTLTPATGSLAVIRGLSLLASPSEAADVRVYDDNYAQIFRWTGAIDEDADVATMVQVNIRSAGVVHLQIGPGYSVEVNDVAVGASVDVATPLAGLQSAVAAVPTNTEMAALLSSDGPIYPWLDALIAYYASANIYDGTTNDAPLAAALVDLRARLTATGVALAAAIPTATQNADAYLDRDMASGPDTSSETTRTPRQALRANRNRIDMQNGVVYKEDDVTPSHTFAVATDPDAEPVVAINPTGGG